MLQRSESGGQNQFAIFTRESSVSTIYMGVDDVIDYFVVCVISTRARAANYHSRNGHRETNYSIRLIRMLQY